MGRSASAALSATSSFPGRMRAHDTHCSRRPPPAGPEAPGRSCVPQPGTEGDSQAAAGAHVQLQPEAPPQQHPGPGAAGLATARATAQPRRVAGFGLKACTTKLAHSCTRRPTCKVRAPQCRGADGDEAGKRGEAARPCGGRQLLLTQGQVLVLQRRCRRGRGRAAGEHGPAQPGPRVLPQALPGDTRARRPRVAVRGVHRGRAAPTPAHSAATGGRGPWLLR